MVDVAKGYVPRLSHPAQEEARDNEVLRLHGSVTQGDPEHQGSGTLPTTGRECVNLASRGCSSEWVERACRKPHSPYTAGHPRVTTRTRDLLPRWIRAQATVIQGSRVTFEARLPSRWPSNAAEKSSSEMGGVVATFRSGLSLSRANRLAMVSKSLTS